MENLPRNADGTLQTYAWPGGYPIYYVTRGEDVLCPTCAQQWDSDPEGVCHWVGGRPDSIEAADINYEDPDLWCDECAERIESAYAEPEDESGTA